MGSSLETLVDNVTGVAGEIHFKQLRKVFPSEQQAKLLLQKQMSSNNASLFTYRS
jgi:hypothetical protein